MVGSDLFAFSSGIDTNMLVVQYENAREAEEGVAGPVKHYLATGDKRYWFSLANFKNQSIYVVGGLVQDKTTRSVLVFSLATHKFTKAASLNTARYASSSAAAGEKVYVFGGRDHN